MFYICDHCNQLRSSDYSFCPGCYETYNGCVHNSTVMPSDKESNLGPARNQTISFKPNDSHHRFNGLVLTLLIGLFITGRQPHALENLATQNFTAQSTPITNLGLIEEKAQSENTYPSELHFLDCLIGSVAGGKVHRTVYTSEVNTLDVTVPTQVSPKKAHSLASVYHYLFVNMRKGFMPSTKAAACRVTVYDAMGQPIAVEG